MRNKISSTKLSLVLLFVIFHFGLFSQINIYKPFPLQYGTWVTTQEGPYDPWGSGIIYYSYTQYGISGDTTIGSYIYKKVTSATSPQYIMPPYVNGQPVSYGTPSFGFAYRNDITNKKVYIYTNIGGQFTDSLWYDFNLTIGDTLKKTYIIDVNSSNFSNPLYLDRRIVTSIDSVLVCGIYHKRFRFNCSGFNTDLIEGVGFVDDFVKTTPICPFEPLYLYYTGLSCSSVSVSDLPTTSINQIAIFPNPAESILQINSLNKNIIFPFSYSIVDCLGKIVAMGTTNENKSINVSKLKNGLYFIMLKDRENNSYKSKFVKE